MTLSLRDRQLSFLDVSFLASNLFDEKNPYYVFRQKVLPALEAQRDPLEAMYCATNGRPPIDPVLVAGVTLLQFMEKAPDRQAVERLRMNLGWKKALGLAVDDRGFHATTLVYFRQRLLEHQQGRVAFDALLQGLEQEGLIARRGKQRLDSTHILAQVAHMSRLEKTRETVRLFLEMLERTGRLGELPEGTVWRERYLDSDVLWHKLSKEVLAAKFQQTGQDMQTLLAWVENHEDLRAHEKTQLLQRVFGEQFEVTPTGPAVRKQEDSGTVQNPHDPEAQWAAKDQDKTKTWVGYKAQIAETVPEESGPKAPGEPTRAFLTEVTTTEAIISDLEGCERLEQQQEEHGLGRAATKYTDGAYVTAQTLAQAAAEGRELIGPAHPATNTRSQGFATDQFDISIAQRRAVCPAGQASTQCSRLENQETGRIEYRFEWGAQCDACPLHAQCTRAGNGRRAVVVGEHHDFLQARRRQMQTPAFQEQMHRRNAIEGTISEFTRNGGRRSRYRGLAKTALANYFQGAAINAKRWIRLLQYRLGAGSAASL
ncbi:MAG: transposase [Planctomycetes bacterium]|nr:transposase [Planctomycetota bacterium]